MSDRLLIRHAGSADLPALLDIYNYYITETAITFDVESYTLEQRRRSWFDLFESGGRHQCLVGEEKNRIIGYACSTSFRPKAAYGMSVETSVYLGPEYCGRGYGGQLYGALFKGLPKARVHRAYAGITLPNPASVALHCTLGFRPCGLFREVGFKFDRYWDVAWFEKTL